MNKLFTTLSVMAVATLGALAQEVTYTVDPAEGSLTEFPESVTITFNGCSQIKKGLLGFPNLTLTKPDKTTQSVNGSSCSVDGINFIVPIPASVDRTEKGEWGLALQAGNSMYSVRCEFEDANPAANPEGTFTWTVEEAAEPASPYSITPAEGTYSELPAEFTITFNDATSVSKSVLGGSNLLLTYPDGSAKQVSASSAVIAGNTVTYKVSSTYDRTAKGAYKVTVLKNSGMYGWKLTLADGSVVTNDEDIVFNYTVGEGGNVGGGDEEGVQFDLEFASFSPISDAATHEFDLGAKTFGTFNFIYNVAGLNVVEGATVTVTGPDYDMTGELSLGGTGFSGNQSYIKGSGFPDLTYNGDYTIHIAQGMIGDAAYLENNETGHANAEINYVLHVINGQDLPENAVKYDLEYKFTNYLDEGTFDLENRSLNAITITYTQSGLQLVEGASVTVTGPDFEATAPITSIKPNFLGANSILHFSEELPDPVYNGEYTLHIAKGSFGDADFIANNKTGHANAEININFTGINGKDKPLIDYDIDMLSLTPRQSASDSTVDISQKTFETIQMTFNKAGLDVVEGATLTLEGPGYYQTGGITFNYAGWNGASTVFKSSLSADPKFNGTYTLTIPAGVIGDAEFLETGTKGHANAEIKYVFEIIGGKDMTGDDKDTSLGITPSIPLSSWTMNLDELTLSFNQKVYFAEDTELKVTWLSNLQSIAYANFGTATLSRLSDTEVKVNFDPIPTVSNTAHEFKLTIPEGTFWNEAYENGEEGGKINGTSEMKWYTLKEVEQVEVLSHTPRTDAYVDGFANGDGIMFQTSNDEIVASVKVVIKEFEGGNDMDMGKTIINATSTDKAANGAICWINEGDYIMCKLDYWYEVTANFYNEDGDEIADCVFEFYGNNDGTVSVNVIGAENAQKTVFNMQGIRVDGNNLSNGLYIIDGKKVVVRK